MSAARRSRGAGTSSIARSSSSNPALDPPRPSFDDDRGAFWRRAGLILLAGGLTYWNSLSGPFIWDDLATIVDNQTIRQWWNLGGVFHPGPDSSVAGRPIVNLSYAINYAIGGLDVLGYHVANIAIHLACALLMFALVRRTLVSPRFGGRFADRSPDLACAAALLWIVHPLNSEVVDYVVQRSESMMALFYLLTLYASLRAASSVRAAGWEAAAVASCALGMACKEAMATAPLMVVTYDVMFIFGSLASAVRARRRLYAGLAATWLIVGALVLTGPRADSAGFSTGVSPWTYLLNQAVVLTEYLRLTFWPERLVAFYGWPAPYSVGDVALNGLLVLACLGLTVFAFIRQSSLAFVGAWCFVTLAPTSSILPIATEVGAERRMYLPLMALAVLAAACLALVSDYARQAWPRAAGLTKPAAWIVVGLLTAGLSARTVVRNRDYASGLALARTVVERRPTSIAHHILGEELTIAGNYEEAAAHLEEATRGDSKAYLRLGAVLFQLGRFNESIEALQAFIRTSQLSYRLVPHWQEPTRNEIVDARNALGQALARTGRWSEAAGQAREVLAVTSSNVAARGLLADSLFAEERFTEAIEQYRELLKARPDDVAALTRLGTSLAANGAHDQALTVFRRAVELDPNNGSAERNLATSLFDNRDFAQALQHAQRAATLTPDDPGVYALAGRALAMLGRPDAARDAFERALRLDPGDAQVRDDLRRVSR